MTLYLKKLKALVSLLVNAYSSSQEPIYELIFETFHPLFL